MKFETTMVSRQMQPGSRLLVLVDAIKNPGAQVNYGTGKDVSDESIKDAGDPLKIEIRSGSYFEVPLDNSFSTKPGQMTSVVAIAGATARDCWRARHLRWCTGTRA